MASGGGWQPIAGWRGRYEISAQGEVRRADGRGVNQWTNPDGYRLVSLSPPRKVERVHRLVAASFVPNPEAKPFVNHIDNDRANNAATNLEWCTQRENIHHAARQGRMSRHWTGRRSPNAGLSDLSAAQIREEYASGMGSMSVLGRRHGVSKRTVCRIVNGKTYAPIR